MVSCYNTGLEDRRCENQSLCFDDSLPTDICSNSYHVVNSYRFHLVSKVIRGKGIHRQPCQQVFAVDKSDHTNHRFVHSSLSKGDMQRCALWILS